MEFEKLTDGAQIPVLGIGTWGMGGKSYIDTSSDRKSVHAIRAAIERGMTHIDTAEVYGKGHAEELVGKAIKGFDRGELLVTSKVWKKNLGYDDVISAAEGSLRRMDTDYIDLYLIHWPNSEFPLKYTMEAMDSLVERELVRFIGVSNFSVELLKEAQACSGNRIVSNQVEYNLLKRGVENDVLPHCQEEGIIVTAYRPIARGELAKPGHSILDELARKYGRTQAQVSINWLISKPGVVTIPKSVEIERIEENLGAIGWRMNQEDVERLEREFKISGP